MVIRVEKNNNYTTVCNYHLRDRNLSLKSKGLLTLMLSLPEDWDYSMNGLASICKEEINAIRTALHELETNKYLTRERTQEETGKFDYLYTVYELPYDRQPYADIPYTVNPIQINTNIQNTDILNTEINTYSFEKFWEIYPRKQDREKAKSKWIKLKPTDTLTTQIIESVERHKKSKQWQDKQYIPLATTFLNGKRWEDEVEVIEDASENYEKNKLNKYEE